MDKKNREMYTGKKALKHSIDRLIYENWGTSHNSVYLNQSLFKAWHVRIGLFKRLMKKADGVKRSTSSMKVNNENFAVLFA